MSVPVKLTLYTRTGCHLCEDMELALRELATEYEFVIDSVTIEDKPYLEHIYGEKVPVLVHGELEICHYYLDRIALMKALGRVWR
jgi:glutaredoxin